MSDFWFILSALCMVTGLVLALTQKSKSPQVIGGVFLVLGSILLFISRANS
jgi:hypothetical protein